MLADNAPAPATREAKRCTCLCCFAQAAGSCPSALLIAPTALPGFSSCPCPPAVRAPAQAAGGGGAGGGGAAWDVGRLLFLRSGAVCCRLCPVQQLEKVGAAHPAELPCIARNQSDLWLLGRRCCRQRCPLAAARCKMRRSPCGSMPAVWTAAQPATLCGCTTWWSVLTAAAVEVSPFGHILR